METVADNLLFWTKNNKLNYEGLHNAQQPTEDKSLSLKKTKYQVRFAVQSRISLT